jgi:aquaporin Z
MVDVLKSRVLVAELFGTAVLMLGGPGAAVLAGEYLGVLGVSLSFGVTLMFLAYMIGPISGCHVNPAVTLGLLVSKKIDRAHAEMAWAGQLLGALVGGGLVFAVASGAPGFERGGFASNGWGDRSPNGFGFVPMMLVEVVLTALLVVAVLSTTSKRFVSSAGGVTVGAVLAVIHMVSIPVDNTSVNPARSFGAAVFSDGGLAQLWAFVVFPMVGGLLGAVVWSLLSGDGVLAGSVPAAAADEVSV